jgi:hypothetical protein
MSDQSLTQHGANRIGAALTGPGRTSLMLVGLGLATWMEFYTYDAVNLVLPDISGSFCACILDRTIFGGNSHGDIVLGRQYVAALAARRALGTRCSRHHPDENSSGVFSAHHVGTGQHEQRTRARVWRAYRGPRDGRLAVDHDKFGPEHDANTGDARNLMGAEERSGRCVSRMSLYDAQSRTCRPRHS